MNPDPNRLTASDRKRADRLALDALAGVVAAIDVTQHLVIVGASPEPLLASHGGAHALISGWGIDADDVLTYAARGRRPGHATVIVVVDDPGGGYVTVSYVRAYELGPAGDA